MIKNAVSLAREVPEMTEANALATAGAKVLTPNDTEAAFDLAQGKAYVDEGVDSALAIDTPVSGDAALVGSVLRDRLKPGDVKRILQVQRESGLRFEDAALRLGLLTPAEAKFAVSRQSGIVAAQNSERPISKKLVAIHAASGPQVEGLRMLRNQLMLRWFESAPARKALAVVSAVRNEGRSFIASNLALVCAQLGKRTLLIDADMRNPSQHELFGLDNQAGLSMVIAGSAGHEVIHRMPFLSDLSVLTAGATPPNPVDLLAQPRFNQLLAELAQRFDVILLDSPPMAACGEAQTIAARAGAALVVARKNVTHLRQVRDVVDAVNEVSATIVGSVINDF